MLLSVIVYNHKLTRGQWLGAGVVFAGISVEAFVKRKGEQAALTSSTDLIFSLCRCPRETRCSGKGKG